MTYDLAVIGGGITGAGVARDAALRGLRVALFEKEDFGAGTTSRSTRLIHGGLRYLAQYDFKLVEEALRERRRLLRLAPHLVRPLPFLYPIYRGRGHSLPFVWSGMLLYDFLTPRRGVKHHRLLAASHCAQLEPTLRREGLRGGFLYYDGQCQYPERLALENILDAADHGATVRNHARVVGLLRDRDAVTGLRVRDESTGQEEDVHARVVLNAAGPWLDEVERLARPDAAPYIRPSKGVHLVVPGFVQHALILETEEDGRVVFAIPWGERTLVGTTDTSFEGAPDAVAASRDDVEYLRRQIRLYLDHEILPSDIHYTTAGLRPLPNQPGKIASEITRRHFIVDHETASGLRGYATVLGGKITTYREIAADLVDFVQRKLGQKPGPRKTHRSPLPGGRFKGNLNAWFNRVRNRAWKLELETDVARHLTDHYGAVAMDVLAMVEAEPSLGQRLRPESPWIWAQVLHAVQREHARTLSDILLRRLPIGLDASQGRDLAQAVAAFVGPRADWDPSEQRRQVAAYQADLERNWRVHDVAAPTSP